MILKQDEVTIDNRNLIAKINNDNRKKRFERCINRLYEHDEFQMITIVTELKTSIRFFASFVIAFSVDDLSTHVVFIDDFHIDNFASITFRVSSSINFSTKKKMISQNF